MKKTVVLLVILLLAISQADTVYAAETDISDLFKEQLEASGAQDIAENLPDEVQEQLDELGITPENGSEWTFSHLLEPMINMIGEAGGEIAGSFGLLLTLIILSALLERVAESGDSATARKTVSAVISTGACITAATPVAGYISDAASAIKLCCNFDAVFIPVWSSIASVSGRAATAAEYSAVMMTVLEGASLLTSGVALPVLRIILAISLTSSLSPSLKLSGAVKLFEKYLKWILGFLAMLVVAVMGLSTAAASAMDDITAKAARFVISSTVPVVGSAMGDALSSVTGCVSLLRTSIGGFGMIAMAFVLLPPLIKGAMWTLSMNICAVVAEILDVKCIKDIADAAGSVLSVMTAIIIFTGTLTIFTLAVMIGKGA